jgi:hypothetical protein
MTKAAMEQVPGGDQRVESPAVLERLEFGKFCVSRDGPILEGAGHTLLGLSPQFPPDLVASCHPDVLGLAPNGASADSEGFLSLKQPYGTVIRPVLSTQAGSGRQVALRLAYRVGIRSEGGDHNLSRRYYKLGSYLAETCGHLNPLTLVQALPPLQGFVRDDKDNKAIAALRPITCAGTGSQAAAAENFLCSSRVDPDLRGKHENFLQGAIIAVMSAVPLHIEADEDTFFGLVDMLWEKLPGGLVQDLLSAGWNVASHFSGRLCITFSHGPSPNCAYYDARGGRWKTSPPAAYDLGPGTRYYQARFDATNASIDELVRDATNALKVDANSTAAISCEEAQRLYVGDWGQPSGESCHSSWRP